MTSKNRVTVKYKTPNPLFEKWLTEWRDQAKESDSKLQYAFSLALKSLKKYPLPLETGKSCKILKGFGDKLCAMLDRKLNDYKKNGEINNENLQTNIVTNVQSPKRNIPKNNTNSPKKRKVSVSNKEYVPAFRSGAYAILIALYEKSLESDYLGYMLKNDIIKAAQDKCDTSFTKAQPGTFYTAWSSMKTLITKKLVDKSSNPAKFSLTESGRSLAQKLRLKKDNNEDGLSQSFDDDNNVETVILDDELSNNYPCFSQCRTSSTVFTSTNLTKFESKTVSSTSITSNASETAKCHTSSTVTNQTKFGSRTVSSSSITSNASETVTCQTKPPTAATSRKFGSKTVSTSSITSNSSETVEHETVIFEPNSFDILLLVDTQETSGLKDVKNDEFISELSRLKVQFEVRHLKVGDYTWICRQRVTKHELVLPYIVERKRTDDFGSSIKDGRFHEQKFRLKQSGMQNLIYLVESYGQNNHVGLPFATLLQAATNTLIQDGFSVKFTENMRGSAEYLSCLTNILSNNYKNKTLVSCPKNNLSPIGFEDDLVSLMFFNEFNKSSSKSKHMKVTDFFVKQLLQLKGMSIDKALAIVEKYPTPLLLKLAYEEKSPADGEKMLSSIQFGKLRKNVGPVISKTIFQLYTLERF